MIRNIFKRREEKIVCDVQSYWALLLKAEVAPDIKKAIDKRSAKLAALAPGKSYAGVNRLAAQKLAHKVLESLNIEEASESELDTLVAIVVRLGLTEEQMQKDKARLIGLCSDAEQTIELPVYIVASKQAKADFLLAETNLKEAQITYHLNKEAWDTACNSTNRVGVSTVSGDWPENVAVRAMYNM